MPPQQTTVSRKRSLENSSIWILIAVIIVSVVAIMPTSAVPASSTKAFVLAAGALVVLAVYILARLSRGNIVLPPLALLGAIWLPAVAYALSTLFSGVPFANAFWGSALEPDTLGFILVVTLFATLTALIVRRADHYKSFLRAGAIAFSVIALVQVLLFIIGRFSPSVVPAGFSLLGSIDDLAFFMGLGVVCVLVTLRFLDLSERTTRALMISSVAALFILAVANSSVVWVLLALVSLGFFVESVMRRGPKTVDSELDSDVATIADSQVDGDDTNRSLVPPLVVLAVSLFFLIGGTLGTALANSMNVNVLNVRPSWQSTLDVAKKTYSTSPAFGSGPSTFGVEWLKYRDPALNATVFWNVDFTSGIGFVPTSFVTTGLVGVLAWIVFLALLIVLGLRMVVFRAPEDPFTRYVAILSFVAMMYLFVMAIFGLPNQVILALAFVFAGLFVSTTRFATGSQQWGVIFARTPRVGFVIVFVLTIVLLSSVVAAYTLVGRYIATAGFAEANKSLSSNELDAADKAVQSAISFAPNASAYKIQAGIASIRLVQIVNSQTMAPAEAQRAFQDTLSSGVNAALTATRLAPSDYQNWVVLGNLYAQAVPLGISGAYESAKNAYEKAKTLNPTNPQIPFVIAQLNVAHRDIKSAVISAKEAIALKQDYIAAIFLLSQLQVQDGNVEEALAAALAAAYFQPNDPNILFQVGILYAAQNDLPNAALALSTAVNVNPQFANARYFLSAVYAKQGNIEAALEQMQAIAGMSEANAKAVETQLAALSGGKNPFPSNLLSVTPAP